MREQINVIGKGITSCAVKPSLPCKTGMFSTGNLTGGDVTSVGKVMLDPDAREEVALMERVKTIDPDHLFTLQGVHSCIPKKEAEQIRKAFQEQGCFPSRFRKAGKDTKLRQLILPYGGIPLAILSSDELGDSIARLSGGDVSKVISIVFTEITRLIYAAKRLRELNMSHCDLHAGNILFNPTTGRFTVIDFGFLQTGKTVAQFILGLAGYETNPVPQHPTEMALFVLLANQDRTLQSLPILSGDVPEEIIEAIEDGATGRSGVRLREALRDSLFQYRSLSRAILPEKVPGGDVMFRNRCKSVLGMRKMTDDIPSTLDKTIKAFRFAIQTIDSFAIGNIIQTILTKLNTGISDLRDTPSASKFIHIFRMVSLQLSNPSPAERISAQKSLEILEPLRRAVVNDPRGEKEGTSHFF